MSAFSITVTVDCETLEQAEQVAAERLNYDEDYGFFYQLGGPVVMPVTGNAPQLGDAEEFDAALLARIGLSTDPVFNGTVWRIPGTGWRIYDASTNPNGYPYGYDHDDEGKEYGEVDSLTVALAAVLDAEKTGWGDNPGYREISIPAIERIIRNLEQVSA